MNVLYFLDSVNIGGTEILALDVCRRAKENGLNITFVTTRGGELEKDFRESGVDFIRLERKFAVDPILIRKLRQIIISRQIEIVHAHQAVEGLHAYFSALATPTKVVLSHHGFVEDSKNRLALRFLIPRVNKNIYVSEGLREWYRTVAGLDSNTKEAVIYNGIDEKRLDYSGDDLRSELGANENTVIIGMIANFYSSPRKDQKTLIEAFAKTATAETNSHLFFVGKVEKGAEPKFVECVKIRDDNGLQKRVHFLGQRTDIPKVLNSLDIFVLSSIHEGLGIAVIEAMLTKIPCIVSDIKPLMEVSGGGKYAEVFETQNPEQLAEKLILLGGNRDLRVELANRAYDFAKRAFSIESHISNLKDLYMSLST